MNIPEFINEISQLNADFRDNIGRAEAAYAAGINRAVISLTQGDEEPAAKEKPYPVPRADDYRT